MKPAGQTVVEKIAERHSTEGAAGRPLHAGDFVTLRPRHVMTHDNTAPVMEKFAGFGLARVRDPHQPVFVLDHDIQNTSAANVAKYRSIETFAREQGIDFWPAGSGIGHQVIVEQIYARPGGLVVASDSHANMYGGVGCVGTPVVRTDAAVIWATGSFWWRIPRTVQVVLEERLPAGSAGKDVIVALCGLYARDEVLNAAVEFTGPGIAALTLEDRLAIANMTTELGALVGWFPVDDTTLEYLARRRDSGKLQRSPTDDELERWRSAPPAPDPDARYAARIRIDLSRVGPHVSGPDTVRIATPLAEIETRHIRVNKAYLVSCVNSRSEDLAAAAAVLDGRRVADGVELYVAAASREVQQQAEASGVWRTLLLAGARPLPPGCGPCIGLGAGLLEPGEIGISATNRNFKGRMGSRDAECWLASPAVVAASAAAGYIRGPLDAPARTPERRIELHDTSSVAGATSVEILPGFPARVAGRLVFVPRDSLDTDAIFGKDHTYRDDMTREEMARVVFENHDPPLGARLRAGDVIVGGASFGTGSSREQAVTALAAKGIALVIAASFSATYLRNAFNNGFPCLECPELVAALRERWSAEILGGARTIVDESQPLEVDFAFGTIDHAGRKFRFAPLDALAQALVIEGGIENRVRRQLAGA